jgi:hypothetical protein
MNLELLKPIEALAASYTKPADIELICELDPGTLLATPEYKKAFLTGFLQKEKIYWEAVESLAVRGSSPAQEALKKRIDEVKNSLLNDSDF